MKKPKKPKVFVPVYSADFIVGHSFFHHALVAVSEAFMRGAKP